MVIVLLVLLVARDASAQMFISSGHDTLRGLPGVEVEVEPFEPALERDGLLRAAVQSDVGQQLRAAGVPVYASQRENPSEAKPYIYVDVNGVQIPGRALYAIAVQVQLRQTLRSPVTASNIVDATTWDARSVLVVPRTSLASVGDTIREYVDQFIRDWKAVH